MMSIQEQPAVVLVLKGADAAGTLAQKNTYVDRVLLLEEQNKKLQRTNLHVSLLERLANW